MIILESITRRRRMMRDNQQESAQKQFVRYIQQGNISEVMKALENNPLLANLNTADTDFMSIAEVAANAGRAEILGVLFDFGAEIPDDLEAVSGYDPGIGETVSIYRKEKALKNKLVSDLTESLLNYAAKVDAIIFYKKLSRASNRHWTDSDDDFLDDSSTIKGDKYGEWLNNTTDIIYAFYTDAGYAHIPSKKRIKEKLESNFKLEDVEANIKKAKDNRYLLWDFIVVPLVKIITFGLVKLKSTKQKAFETSNTTLYKAFEDQLKTTISQVGENLILNDHTLQLINASKLYDIISSARSAQELFDNLSTLFATSSNIYEILNSNNVKGQTPLMALLDKRFENNNISDADQKDIVKLLLGYGAKPSYKSKVMTQDALTFAKSEDDLQEYFQLLNGAHQHYKNLSNDLNQILSGLNSANIDSTAQQITNLFDSSGAAVKFRKDDIKKILDCKENCPANRADFLLAYRQQQINKQLSRDYHKSIVPVGTVLSQDPLPSAPPLYNTDGGEPQIEGAPTPNNINATTKGWGAGSVEPDAGVKYILGKHTAKVLSRIGRETQMQV